MCISGEKQKSSIRETNEGEYDLLVNGFFLSVTRFSAVTNIENLGALKTIGNLLKNGAG